MAVYILQDVCLWLGVALMLRYVWCVAYGRPAKLAAVAESWPPSLFNEHQLCTFAPPTQPQTQQRPHQGRWIFLWKENTFNSPPLVVCTFIRWIHTSALAEWADRYISLLLSPEIRPLVACK